MTEGGVFLIKLFKIFFLVRIIDTFKDEMSFISKVKGFSVFIGWRLMEGEEVGD